jgi:hypothetical protein
MNIRTCIALPLLALYARKWSTGCKHQGVPRHRRIRPRQATVGPLHPKAEGALLLDILLLLNLLLPSTLLLDILTTLLLPSTLDILTTLLLRDRGKQTPSPTRAPPGPTRTLLSTLKNMMGIMTVTWMAMRVLYRFLWPVIVTRKSQRQNSRVNGNSMLKVVLMWIVSRYIMMIMVKDGSSEVRFCSVLLFVFNVQHHSSDAD